MQQLYSVIETDQKLIKPTLIEDIKDFLISTSNFCHKHNKFLQQECLTLLNQIKENNSKYKMIHGPLDVVQCFQSKYKKSKIREAYILQLQQDKNIDDITMKEIIETQQNYDKYEFTSQDLQVLFDKSKCNQIEEIFIINENLRLQYNIIIEIHKIMCKILTLVRIKNIRNNFFNKTYEMIFIINRLLIPAYNNSIDLINKYYEKERNQFPHELELNIKIDLIKY